MYKESHVKRDGEYVSLTSNIVLTQLDGIVHVIHILVFKNGGHAFCFASLCFHFKDNTFAFEPYQKIQFETTLFVEVVQPLPGLTKEISHEILKSIDTDIEEEPILDIKVEFTYSQLMSKLLRLPKFLQMEIGKALVANASEGFEDEDDEE